MGGVRAPSTATPGGLLTRVRTAGLLVASLAGLLLLDYQPLITLVFLGILACAAAEWALLAAGSSRLRSTLFVVGIIAASLIALTLPMHLKLNVLAVAALFWAFALALLWRIQATAGLLPAWAAGWLAAGVPALVPAFLALVVLQDLDPWLLPQLLLLVVTADTAAYFGGRAWGRARLASRISPGKTWAGAWSALCVAPLVAMLLNLLPVHAPWPAWQAGAVAGLIVVSAITGDLLESLFKRQAGAKDSGTLLPGHGGILDRIDSLLAAAPVYALIHLLRADFQ